MTGFRRITKIFAIVLQTKVASALEGLTKELRGVGNMVYFSWWQHSTA